jgi:dUTP pyrophosphatase
MNVLIKKLYPETKIPIRANSSDAGLDCFAHWEKITDQYFEYGLGFSLEPPEGWCTLIFPRSSISKYDLILANSVAIIDQGYRGELLCRFKKTKEHGKYYEVGDRICQMIFYQYPKLQLEIVEDLDFTTDRGGGFGSSGK